MEASGSGSSIVSLSAQVLELKQAIQGFSARLENLCHDQCITQQIVTQMFEEVKHSRMDSYKYYQSLVSRLNEQSPNVYVVDDIASKASSPSSQVFTIPNFSVSYGQMNNNVAGPSYSDRHAHYQYNASSSRVTVTAHTQSTTAFGSNRNIGELARAVTCFEQEKNLPGVQYSYNGGPNGDPVIYHHKEHVTPDNNDTIPPTVLASQNYYNQPLQTLKEFRPNGDGDPLEMENKLQMGITDKPDDANVSTEKLICAYCPRKFDHHHSIALHIRSCKKKHDAILAVSQNNGGSSDDGASSASPTSSAQTLLDTDQIPSPGGKLGKMIKCGHCDRSFPTQHQASSHERVHTGDRPFSCYICQVKFAHGGNMIKHIKSKHPKYNPYVCRFCQTNFKTHTEVQTHRKTCEPCRRGLKREGHKVTPTKVKNKRRRASESEDTATASEDEGSLPDFSGDIQQRNGRDAGEEQGGALPVAKLEVAETVSRNATEKNPDLNPIIKEETENM